MAAETGDTYRRSRSIERLVGRPESTERQETFLGKLLVETSVGEAHRKHIAQIADGDEGRESPSASAVAKHVTEEDTGDNDFGISQLSLWNSSKIGNYDFPPH